MCYAPIQRLCEEAFTHMCHAVTHITSEYTGVLEAVGNKKKGLIFHTSELKRSLTVNQRE